MTSYNNLYWGTLIDAGKKPSPLLEQLCLGLAKIIVNTCLTMNHGQS